MSFGVLQDKLLESKKIAFFGKTIVLLVCIGAILVALLIIIKRKNLPLKATNRYILTTLAVLFLYEMGNFTYKYFRGQSYSLFIEKAFAKSDSVYQYNLSEKPDIYYFVFDSYTSFSTIKYHLGFDNYQLKKQLEAKGFFVVDSSHSNYNFTPFSIASVLNMQYIKDADPYLMRDAANFELGNRLYRNNILFSVLQNNGYRISSFSILDSRDQLNMLGTFGPESPHTWLRKQTMERVYLNPWITRKLISLFRKSNASPSKIRQSIVTYRRYQRLALEFALKKTVITKEDSPRFTFVHFMIPHQPYIFNADGKERPPSPLQEDEQVGYLTQVQYCNKIITMMVEKILANKARKSIIVLQGDHGFRQYPTPIPDGADYACLNAVYLYNRDYGQFNKNISLVNTYRLILNSLSKNKIPLMKDSMFRYVQKR